MLAGYSTIIIILSTTIVFLEKPDTCDKKNGIYPKRYQIVTLNYNKTDIKGQYKNMMRNQKGVYIVLGGRSSLTMWGRLRVPGLGYPYLRHRKLLMGDLVRISVYPRGYPFFLTHICNRLHSFPHHYTQLVDNLGIT